MSALPQLDDDTAQFRVPASHVERLLELGYEKAEIYAIVAPRRTLDRRIKNDELLTIAESDRVQRLERVMENAIRVFANADKANIWLRRPNRGMDRAIPINLLTSESGARKVENMLGAIEHGMFS